MDRKNYVLWSLMRLSQVFLSVVCRVLKLRRRIVGPQCEIIAFIVCKKWRFGKNCLEVALL